jgi:bacteriocin-like protein
MSEKRKPHSTEPKPKADPTEALPPRTLNDDELKSVVGGKGHAPVTYDPGIGGRGALGTQIV